MCTYFDDAGMPKKAVDSSSGLNPNSTETPSLSDGSKLVVAVYPFTAIEPGDLSLVPIL
jgi:hypothetical protein